VKFAKVRRRHGGFGAILSDRLQRAAGPYRWATRRHRTRLFDHFIGCGKK